MKKILILMLTGIILLMDISCNKSNPIFPKESSSGKLVFVKIDSTIGPSGIYVMNIDGTGLTPLAVPGDTIYFPGTWGEKYILGKTTNPSFLLHPQWSPDGEKIVCELTWAYDGYVIMIMNADGSNKHVLWKVHSSARWPQWSPSGDKILFWRSGYLGAMFAIGIVDSNGENDRNFFIMDYSGANLQIFEGDSVWIHGNYQWAPLGGVAAIGSINKRPDTIHVVGNNLANEIFILDDSARISKRLTRNSIDEQGFQLSPDGNFVAFQKDASYWIMSLHTQNITKVDVGTNLDAFWNWSSDGRKIVYVKDRYLYYLDIGTLEIKQITSFRATQPDLYVPTN